MKIKHIFFDLDHTLWDFEANSRATFIKILKENKVDVNFEKFLNYYKQINLEYWRLFRNDAISKEKLRYGRLKDTFDKINVVVSDDMIHLLSEDYIKYLSSFNKVFDGTYEILDYLSKKYTLHIITNGFSEVQNLKMVNSKLDIYFEKIITSESVGVKKPNPKIFQYALEQSNAIPSECVMIGDSWEADIMGAKNFGIKPIYCNFENQSVGESVISIENLFDLKKYL
jgi:putative hydrolase of the HAD superfamily